MNMASTKSLIDDSASNVAMLHSVQLLLVALSFFKVFSNTFASKFIVGPHCMLARAGAGMLEAIVTCEVRSWAWQPKTA